MGSNFGEESNLTIEKSLLELRSTSGTAIIDISSNEESHSKSEPSNKNTEYTPQIQPPNNTQKLPNSQIVDDAAIFGICLAAKLRQLPDVARQKIIYDIQGMFLRRSQNLLTSVVAEEREVEDDVIVEEQIQPDPFDDKMFTPDVENSKTMVIAGEGYGLAEQISASDCIAEQISASDCSQTTNPKRTEPCTSRVGKNRPTKAIWAEIIAMYKRNLSLSAIARRLKISRHSVQVWIHQCVLSGLIDEYPPRPEPVQRTDSSTTQSLCFRPIAPKITTTEPLNKIPIPPVTSPKTPRKKSQISDQSKNLGFNAKDVYIYF